MSRELAVVAVLISAMALWLPTRSQSFTTVTVDGRTVRMLVAGGGEATVVFENGYAVPLETWGKVQPAVSGFAATVAYDRAGFGLSEDGPAPRDGLRIAAELHRALELADLAPPYVLVGHSLGGLYVRIFAGLYPDEVAGLVLVDPTLSADGTEAGLPELDVLSDTVSQARASPVPAGIPVYLIDAVGPPELPFATAAIRDARAAGRAENMADSRAYEDWLDGVPGGVLVYTERSGHNVPIERPELVVETIRRIVDAAPR
jgi:pimeloyl-ACP methyl ester carboxylesterase